MKEPSFKFLQPPKCDVSIVVVNFNTRQTLLNCLQSIYTHTQDISFETIVVDNDSVDGSADAVAEQFPQIQLIRNFSNPGLSVGYNQGIRKSRGRYVVLLNSDTLLIENCFLKLTRYLDKNPEFHIASPQIVDESGKPFSMRLWQDTPMDAFWRILGKYNIAGEQDRMGKIEPKEVEALGGSCFVVRRALFEIIGLYDENFFLYNEEDDFCRRARQAGKKVCYYPETSIHHLLGKSTHLPEHREKVILETYKSYLHFYSKYYSLPWNIFLRFVYCCTFVLGMGTSLLKYVFKRNSMAVDDRLSFKLKLLFMRVPFRS
ncbi:MAG: glycosyltransferase family 2 protein [Nitrospinales bacterium]